MLPIDVAGADRWGRLLSAIRRLYGARHGFGEVSLGELSRLVWAERDNTHFACLAPSGVGHVMAFLDGIVASAYN